MRLLLDSSVFFRLAVEPEKVPESLRQIVGDAEVRVLSVASAWEFAIKSAAGKLTLPAPVTQWVSTRAAAMAVTVEPVRLAYVAAVEALPLHHRDPFDRLLIAHAVIEDLILVSQDRVFSRYAVKLISA